MPEYESGYEEFDVDDVRDVGKARVSRPYKTADKTTELLGLFQNPEGLIKELSLNQRQAKNLRSLVIGGGTGAIHRALSSYIGDIPASMAGAALSAWLAKKFISPGE